MSGVNDQHTMMTEMCFHGAFTWRVSDVCDKMTLSTHGGRQCYHSPDFYIEPQTYKYRLELYPDGTGAGRHTHAAIHLVTLQGMYDRGLTWPPNFKMKISLVNQYGGGHLDYILSPDAEGNFTQPQWETFVPLVELRHPDSIYVRDDVMFIKIIKMKKTVPTIFDYVSSAVCVDGTQLL